MGERVRQVNDAGRVEFDPSTVTVPPTAADDLTESPLVVADRIIIKDTASTADDGTGGEDSSVLEFRSSRAAVEVDIPTDPDGETQVSGNLVIKGGSIYSDGYVAGESGWAIDHDGEAEFNDVTVRGLIAGGSITQVDDGDALNGGLSLSDYDGDLSGQNLLANFGFETDLSGWEVRANCTIARVTGTVRTAPGALRTTGTNTNQASVQTLSANGSRIAVTAGHKYSFFVWVRTATTARSTGIGITWYDVSNAVISTSSSARANDSTTFGARGFDATAPAGAVSCVLWVEFGTTTGAVGEQHYLDDCAFWDRTAFEALGWSFGGSGLSKVYLSCDGSTNNFYFELTDVTDTWYVQTPTITVDPRRAYRAGAYFKCAQTVSPGATESQVAQAQLVFNPSGTPETDGALTDLGVNPTVFTYADNFTTGGDGLANTVTPTQVCARFGHPNAIVSIASASSAFIRNMSLVQSGQVSGHVAPVGAITGLQLGTKTCTSASVGSTSINVYTSAMLSGAAESLANIMKFSYPGGYLDPNRSYYVQLTFECDCYNLILGTSDTFVRILASLDGGSNYFQIPNALGMARVCQDGSGTVRERFHVMGTLYVPKGSTPYIDCQFAHNTGATASNCEHAALSWLAIPA